MTRTARSAPAHALGSTSWATQRPPPPFLTWAALSVHARRPMVADMVERRRAFLSEQIRKERATLEAVGQEEGPAARIARAMVDLTIGTFELELNWLDDLLVATGVRVAYARPSRAKGPAQPEGHPRPRKR